MEPSRERSPLRPRRATLKADPFAQLKLLDLQAVDAALDLAAHRLATLPAAQAVRELTARRDEVAMERGRAQTAVDDLSREQRKADADVERVKTRRTRDRERVDSGQVGDARQLQALQHEIETLDRRISDLEDEDLEVMERLETAQTELEALGTEVERLEAELAEQVAARDAATAEIDEQRVRTEQERIAIAAEIPDALRALYERLRAQLNGVGVGEIAHGRCGGCRLDIGAADLARMRSAPPDEVLRCEECDRILVRTAESGI